MSTNTPPVINTGATSTTPPDEKPAYTTTEFWLAGVAPLIVSLLTLFNIGHVDLTNDPRAQAIIKIGAFVAAAIGAGFYAHSRGKVKAGASVKQAIETLVQLLPTVASQLPQPAPAQVTVTTPPAPEPLQPLQMSIGEGWMGTGEGLNETEQEQIGELVSEIVNSHLKNHLSDAINVLEERLRYPVIDKSKVEQQSTVPTGAHVPPVADVEHGSAGFHAPSF
jgi:hypothetical protein